ncbi:MAG: DapH/DapD/GlmU-related protein [Candidatus Hodarchaeales archaeon]|jgi:acetyltransferase-like isoleucine patch superfamily enzyme
MIFLLFQFLIFIICVSTFYFAFLVINAVEFSFLPSYLSTLISFLGAVVISYCLILFVLVAINKFARFLLKNENDELQGMEETLWWIKETSWDIAYTITSKLCFHSPCPDFIARLFGFHKEKGVSLLGRLMDPEMITMGPGTMVGTGAIVSGHQIRSKKIVLKKVKIGKNCMIGGYTIVLPGVKIGDNVQVGAGSLIPSNWKLESNSLYSGTPVKKVKDLNPENFL